MKDQRAHRDVEQIQEMLDRWTARESGASGAPRAAAGRGRRRRRGVAGGIAVAVAAATVVIMPHFFSTSPTTNEATDPSNGVTTTAPSTSRDTPTPYVDPCPTHPVLLRAKWTSVTPGVLAESVRLCPAQFKGVTSPWQAPTDALVMRVPELVKAVRTLPTDGEMCPALDVPAEPFAIVFSYRDGHVVTVSSRYTTCGVVRLGGKRVSAPTLKLLFERALVQQRSALELPSMVGEPR